MHTKWRSVIFCMSQRVSGKMCRSQAEWFITRHAAHSTLITDPWLRVDGTDGYAAKKLSEVSAKTAIALSRVTRRRQKGIPRIICARIPRKG